MNRGDERSKHRICSRILLASYDLNDVFLAGHAKFLCVFFFVLGGFFFWGGWCFFWTSERQGVLYMNLEACGKSNESSATSTNQHEVRTN